MFTMTTKEELTKEIGNSFLHESYCGKATIVSMERVKGSNGSLSEGLKFIVDTDLGTANFTVWFKKKDGQPNEFGVKGLSAVMTLLNLDPSKFVIKESFENNKVRELINIPKDLEIGLFLEHFSESYDGKTIIKHNLRGSYSAKTGKTVAETFNKTEARMMNKWKEEAIRNNIDAGVYVSKSTETVPNGADFQEDEFPF